MKNLICLSVLMIASLTAVCQDKDTEARVYYTSAEENFNKGTYLGAEKCIEELEKAENALGATNSKILYLKIKSFDKFYSRYYFFDEIMCLKKFFEITDPKSFPFDKYSEMVKINDGYLAIFVKDKDFNKKISDSVFISKNPTISPRYKYSDATEYDHGDIFWSESFKRSVNSKESDLWRDEGFNKASTYFNLAAKKGNKKAMSALSGMYLHGQGVIIDEKKSLQYALDANDTSTLALLYFIAGEKLINDGNQIIEWCIGVFTNSTDSFTAQEAARALAQIYEKGLAGVTKDNYKAMEWYIKANSKGCDCKPYMDGIVIIGIDNDDKKTQKAVRELYNTQMKSKH